MDLVSGSTSRTPPLPPYSISNGAEPATSDIPAIFGSQSQRSIFARQGLRSATPPYDGPHRSAVFALRLEAGEQMLPVGVGSCEKGNRESRSRLTSRRAFRASYWKAMSFQRVLPGKQAWMVNNGS